MATKRDGDEPKQAETVAVRVTTQPFGSKSDSARASANSHEPASEKPFDPLKSSPIEYSTDLYTLLITADVPLVPKDQLFETRPAGARVAAPDPRVAPPDPLPAVESPPSSIAIPVHSKRNLVVGVLAFIALALGLFFSMRDRTQTVTTPDEPNTQATETIVPPAVSPPAQALVSPPPPTSSTTQQAEPPKPDHPSSTPSRSGATGTAAPSSRPQNHSAAKPTSGTASPQERAHPAIGPRPE